MLDLHPGDGRGAASIASSGAASVVAAHRAGSPAPDAAPATVRPVADGPLPFEDAAFGLVLCLEFDPNTEDRGASLDELRRVIADGGLAVISWRRADLEPNGNPRPDLEGLIALRFATVQAYAAAGRAGLLVSRPGGVPELRDRVDAAPSRTVVVAGDGELPDLPDVAILDTPAELARVEDEARRWEERARSAEVAAAAARNREGAIYLALEHARHEAEMAREEAERARNVVAAVTTSASWRVTAPLRGAKGAFRPRRTHEPEPESAAGQETASLPEALAAELMAEPPWMYEWDLGGGAKTTVHHPFLNDVHDTRRQMFEAQVRKALEQAGPDARAIDLGCNEGWFSHRLLDWGAAKVVGVDARDVNIRRARLVRDHLQIPEDRLQFHQEDVLALNAEDLGEFDVVLMLGLIYHLEDPVKAVRVARSLCRSMCVIESQVTAQNSPLEWRDRDRNPIPSPASFAVLAEPDSAVNPLASVEGGLLSLIPNRAAMAEMCRAAGFGHTEFVSPPAGAERWYANGDRALLIAYR